MHQSREVIARRVPDDLPRNPVLEDAILEGWGTRVGNGGSLDRRRSSLFEQFVPRGNLRREQLRIEPFIPHKLLSPELGGVLGIGVTDDDPSRQVALRIDPDQHLSISLDSQDVDLGNSVNPAGLALNQFFADQFGILSNCLTQLIDQVDVVGPPFGIRQKLGSLVGVVDENRLCTQYRDQLTIKVFNADSLAIEIPLRTLFGLLTETGRYIEANGTRCFDVFDHFSEER